MKTPHLHLLGVVLLLLPKAATAQFDFIVDLFNALIGLFCLVPILNLFCNDDCNPDPCANGVCTDQVLGGFMCTCDEGWTGDTCEETLVPNNSTRCTPTAGTCQADEASLADILETAAPGSTIAMCGDSTITTTNGPFNIVNDDITFCCATTDCILESGVPDRILQVTGQSVTLQDLTFQNGQAMGNDGGTGGNVQIDAMGNHRIIDSAFLNGMAADSGGNVYIRTVDGTVTIEGSVFSDGTTSMHGGGLHVIGALDVTVTGTLFERNVALSGGGLSTTRGDEDATGQVVTIQDSTFNMNSTALGGGFLVSIMGQLPSLSILNTEFIANNAAQLGGAGVVAEFFEDIALEFSGNSGERNTADSPICAEIFTIIEETTSILCLEVKADFP